MQRTSRSVESGAAGAKSGIAKNWLILILLSSAGAIIYGLPYFRNYFYDAYVQTYGLTNSQMGALGGAYGFLGLFSYIIGGALADRFSAKKLLILSLVLTGLGGFLHLFFTSYTALLVIYGVWGVTSLLTFWPAIMKVVRLQGNADEQARAYGIFEGGRGVFNSGQLAVATAIFSAFVATAPAIGLKWIIIFYSAAPVILGGAFVFLLEEPADARVSAKKHQAPAPQSPVDGVSGASKQRRRTASFAWSDLIAVVKMPSVWLVVGILFLTYTFNLSFYYFTPYASNVMGLSAVSAALLTVIAQYIRPFAAPAGGFLADRFSRAGVMGIGFFVLAAATSALIYSSSMHGTARTVVLVGSCTVIYTAMYSNFGIYFSLLSEGGVTLKHAAMAIGVVSTFGYLPESLAPLAAGAILDRYPGAAGYRYFFSGLVACALLGAALCFVWTRLYGQRKLGNRAVPAPDPAAPSSTAPLSTPTDDPGHGEPK